MSNESKIDSKSQRVYAPYRHVHVPYSHVPNAKREYTGEGREDLLDPTDSVDPTDYLETIGNNWPKESLDMSKCHDTDSELDIDKYMDDECIKEVVEEDDLDTDDEFDFDSGLHLDSHIINQAIRGTVRKYIHDLQHSRKTLDTACQALHAERRENLLQIASLRNKVMFAEKASGVLVENTRNESLKSILDVLKQNYWYVECKPYKAPKCEYCDENRMAVYSDSKTGAEVKAKCSCSKVLHTYTAIEAECVSIDITDSKILMHLTSDYDGTHLATVYMPNRDNSKNLDPSNDTVFGVGCTETPTYHEYYFTSLARAQWYAGVLAYVEAGGDGVLEGGRLTGFVKFVTSKSDEACKVQ